jgi:hypothetical protein
VALTSVDLQDPRMTTTDENKAFIKEMLGSKKQLTDYCTGTATPCSLRRA